MIRRAALAALLFATVAPAAQTSQQNSGSNQVALRSDDVVDHLEAAIAWYRHVMAEEQSSIATTDILLRTETHQDTLQALQLAFDFARAAAAFQAAVRQPQSAAPAGSTTGAGRTLDDVLARANARVTGLTNQINDINTTLAGSVKNRAVVEAQRQELQAELGLAQEIQKTVQAMVAFAGANAGSGSGAGGLQGQVNELARSVPEAQQPPPHSKTRGTETPAPATPAKNAAAPPAQVFHPENEGLIGLFSELFAFERDRLAMNTLIGETDALGKNINNLRQPLVTQLRTSLKQSEDIIAAANSQTAEQVAAGQKQIAALTTQFRELSTVIVPLGEEAIMVESVRGSLVEWRDSLTEEYHAAARYLVIRAGGLLLAIVIVLAISELWRRATFRYIHEARRRRQFLLIRRIVVTFAIVVVFVLGFVTQFGSVATYAGFLTAGLAVALQNVILAVIAYFFFIGRYGVRVGDRVTISGVTGDVLELGLVRIYLMELAGTPGDMHATGRVVVFSNSVLFQPQALFKQLPGTNYVWHSITINLAPESDIEVAEKRLGGAVNGVFERYRRDIEQQHATMERAVEIELKNPKPECRFLFTGAALQFRVRYPIDLKKGTDADAEMMRALTDAVNQEPALKLAPEGAPKLETV